MTNTETHVERLEAALKEIAAVVAHALDEDYGRDAGQVQRLTLRTIRTMARTALKEDV